MATFTRVIAFLLFVGIGRCAEGPNLQCQKEDLLKGLEKHFVSRNLGSFSNPSTHKVSVVIEHSLIGPPEGLEKARFRNFKQVEQWLRSRERFHDQATNEHHPHREVRNGVFANPNLFEYDNMGINHNSWYLSRVYFSVSKGQAYISKVVIYDGD